MIHLWCLYHLDEPVVAVAEAARVLRPGGRYYASTGARDNDPEIVPEGYPATTFDAEEAVGIVATGFGYYFCYLRSRAGTHLLLLEVSDEDER